MDVFLNGQVNPQAFEMDVRQATHDLSDVLGAAARTGCAKVESTHFLIAIARAGGGPTQKRLQRLGIGTEQWESGLSACVSRTGGLPPAQLTEEALAPSGAAMLAAVRQHAAKYRLPRVNESVLLLACLENLTPAAGDLFQEADIDCESWCAELRDALEPVVSVAAFDATGAVRAESFSPGGKKVIFLMRTEAESLGYEKADPRHLLLGLLEFEGGATQYALYSQGRAPKKLQEATVLNLRSRGHRTRSTVTPDREHFQPLLQRILTMAGEFAGRGHCAQIAEPHLFLALLAVDSAARRILTDEKCDLEALRGAAERFDVGDEKVAETEDAATAADIETVRERLMSRIVGQDDTIQSILPYIQRMRFGFTSPGRPVGVFLFCGQSGSGKTEMAKELARAVYGSEENLIYLEMGQFNSPESMNIFLGAPPGYVGYGEGKLTNGLRDKPRAVVLFDEVEKAHPRVLDSLLRFIDEGRIDDPAGPVRDGSQCLVILTSNVGAQELSRLWQKVAGNPNWRTEIRKLLRQEFQKHSFRVEFLNRFDEIFLFHTLERKHYAEIASRLLAKELARLREQRQITVHADDGVAKAIADYCEEISEGARAVRRLVQSIVITPVIDFVVSNACAPPIELAVRAHRPSPDPDCEPAGIVSFAKPAGAGGRG